MAEITHGVSTGKVTTSVSTPLVVQSGIVFAVGTAPVQAGEGKVNEIVRAGNYAEAVKAMGYSQDWGKYGLCEVIYTMFQLYQVAPIFMVNVLDPKKHKKAVASTKYTVTDNQIKLPIDAIGDSIEVTGKTAGTDYNVFYSGENCVVEFVNETTGELDVAYDTVDPTMVTKEDVIGGYDVATHVSTGLELLDGVFPKYVTVPDIILCPNWSHDSEVAAVMSAKAENINGIFEAIAILDVDTTQVSHYSEVPEWKKGKNFMKANELVCFPKLKLGDRIYNYSTQLAGTLARTDNSEEFGGGSPCESSSNKTLQAEAMVLADGTEVMLDVQQANYLNDNGVVTALNFYNGFVSWGNYTACFPINTDPVDYYYNISRMFKWVAKTVILSTWSYIDRRMSRRLLETILQSINDWLNSMTAEEKILGGRVEFQDDENTLTALMSGKAKFHIYITPAAPLEELEYILEYDMNYLAQILTI